GDDVDVGKGRLGLRSDRRQERHGNRSKSVAARPTKKTAFPKIPKLHNTPPAYHRPNTCIMLDISSVVAGMICQIGAGTFGKAGESKLYIETIPVVATKFY